MDQFAAHLDRGWDLVSRGDFAGALLSAQKSLELDAESPEAHNLAGYIHHIEGRADDALDHYRQAIAIDETYVEAMLNAAEVMIHALRDYDGGLSMVEEALDFAEGDDEIADALLLKLDAHMQQGQDEQANQLARRLPEGPFENPHLDFLVGRARFEAGDLEGSARHLERAVEREPESGEAHYFLGLLIEARGNPRGATLEFLRARELEAREPRPPWSESAEAFERKAAEAMAKLPPALAAVLDGALVVIADLPGPEVVAEGVDPRVGVLFDAIVDAQGKSVAGGPEALAARAERIFIYQRNIERWARTALETAEELARAIEHEAALTFPHLLPKA